MSDFFHYKIKKHKIQVQIIKICRVTKKYSRDFFRVENEFLNHFLLLKLVLKTIRNIMTSIWLTKSVSIEQ